MDNSILSAKKSLKSKKKKNFFDAVDILDAGRYEKQAFYFWSALGKYCQCNRY